MTDVEILAVALVGVGVYTTWLQFKYNHLLKWAKHAQLALIMGQMILRDIKEESDEDADSPASDS